VRLFSTAGSLVDTAVTNVYGIFNFAVEPGEYKMTVTMGGFKYPSEFVREAEDYPISNLYHGDVRQMGAEDFRRFSLPIDPEESGDLQRTKEIVQDRVSKVWNRLSLVLFVVGTLYALYMIKLNGGVYDYSVFGLYILALVLSVALSRRGHESEVTLAGDGVSGVEVYLKNPASNLLIDKRITAHDGSYQFVVTKGEYQIHLNSTEYVEVVDGSHKVLTNKNNNPMVISRDIYLNKKDPK